MDPKSDSEILLLKNIFLYERFRNSSRHRNSVRDPVLFESHLLSEVYNIYNQITPFIKFLSPFSLYSDHTLDVYPGLRVFSLMKKIYHLILKAFT